MLTWENELLQLATKNLTPTKPNNAAKHLNAPLVLFEKHGEIFMVKLVSTGEFPQSIHRQSFVWPQRVATTRSSFIGRCFIPKNRPTLPCLLSLVCSYAVRSHRAILLIRFISLPVFFSELHMNLQMQILVENQITVHIWIKCSASEWISYKHSTFLLSDAAALILLTQCQSIQLLHVTSFKNALYD